MRHTKKQIKQQCLEVLKELYGVMTTRADRRPAWFRVDYGVCGNYEKLATMRLGQSRMFWSDFKKAVKTWPRWTQDECFIAAR